MFLLGGSNTFLVVPRLWISLEKVLSSEQETGAHGNLGGRTPAEHPFCSNNYIRVGITVEAPDQLTSLVQYFLVFPITTLCCVTPAGDLPGAGARGIGLAPMAELALASKAAGDTWSPRKGAAQVMTLAQRWLLV